MLILRAFFVLLFVPLMSFALDNRVVATVNNQVITRAQLDAAVTKAYPDGEVPADVRSQVLDALENNLVLDEFIKSTPGLKAQLNQMIENIQKQNNLSPAEFEKDILRRGLTMKQYKEKIFIENNLPPAPTYSDAAVQAFIRQHSQYVEKVAQNNSLQGGLCSFKAVRLSGHPTGVQVLDALNKAPEQRLALGAVAPEVRQFLARGAVGKVITLPGKAGQTVYIQKTSEPTPSPAEQQEIARQMMLDQWRQEQKLRLIDRLRYDMVITENLK